MCVCVCVFGCVAVYLDNNQCCTDEYDTISKFLFNLALLSDELNSPFSTVVLRSHLRLTQTKPNFTFFFFKSLNNFSEENYWQKNHRRSLARSHALIVRDTKQLQKYWSLISNKIERETNRHSSPSHDMPETNKNVFNNKNKTREYCWSILGFLLCACCVCTRLTLYGRNGRREANETKKKKLVETLVEHQKVFNHNSCCCRETQTTLQITHLTFRIELETPHKQCGGRWTNFILIFCLVLLIKLWFFF